MATVVLQTAGAVIGGAIGGPVGAAIGRALGAAAGYLADRELFGPPDRNIEGHRLENARFLSSQEGTPIPRLYGRARLSGQIIWATRFEEVQETETHGGKGGPKTRVTNYSYFANFAIGLCEGEIACIRRIWADGKQLDQNDITVRLHKGTNSQLPDSLIEAKQGAGNAPAYRGLAYLVFEHFPLEDFGNRIPQISVEVIKPVGTLEKHIKAVALLPGASEFGYDPNPVSEKTSDVSLNNLNSHNTLASSDWSASMDELQALCPNLNSVALIAAWFGDDLRAGQCTCQPRVETQSRVIHEGENWQVSGLSRASATLVSQIDGKPAYGGTPSDGAIIRAIQDTRQRGLKTTFYPFLMMDVAAGNSLPDPYGGTGQPAYPWRGRLTCNPAIGRPATADGTAGAATQIDAFVGTAQPQHFAITGNTVVYSGPTEWSYRRLILHYATLCVAAGGVDAFLIGSELRGLTRIRDNTGAFVFVGHLKDLAADVRTILGPQTKISYAADWSEYFGYQPDDGSGDVHYNLDALWADANIDMVAIDNYMPLSDWRDDGAPDGKATSSRDRAVMAAGIAGGEGYDWYYASESDRHNGLRTPITDGLGKPWVYRFKDLGNWWSNSHYPRLGGTEAANPTAWQPEMKPIWFTELGCPAVDKGANQPNVFVDPKSSESFFPWFSGGGRDDAVQAVFLEAHQRHWDADHPQFDSANNPMSTSYSGRMVDAGNIHLWAWDVRPYPQFPENTELWSDGENWRLGHWLNGRLGGARLADLVSGILSDHGFDGYDVTELHGFVDGYVIAGLSSARNALQTLADTHQLRILEDGDTLSMRTPGLRKPVQLPEADFVDVKDEPRLKIRQQQESELPKSVVLEHTDPSLEFQPTTTYSRRIEGKFENQAALSAPMILSRELAYGLVDDWLRAAWVGRDVVQLELPRRYQHLQIGDHVEFAMPALPGRWLITRIEESDVIALELRSITTTNAQTAHAQKRAPVVVTADRSGLPLAHLLDLPVLTGDDPHAAARVAVTSQPWPGPHDVYSAAGDAAYAYRQTVLLRATIGKLALALSPGPVGRWDHGNFLIVALHAGSLSSRSAAQILNGGNAAAVRSANGSWEVIQFQTAELVGPDLWRLSGLLRAQAGTDAEMQAGAAADAAFVLLDGAAAPLTYEPHEAGLALNWRIAPTGRAVSDPGNAGLTFTPGVRPFIPLQPVHLRLDIAANGDAGFTWIRRDRFNADAWNAGEIPMSEATERYDVCIKDGGTIVRQWQTDVPSAIYARADQLADLTAFPADLTLQVAQISATHGNGSVATLPFTLT